MGFVSTISSSMLAIRARGHGEVVQVIYAVRI